MKRLDLIIDALEMVLISSECDTYLEALAAARELRELEPVIWKSSGDGWSYEKPLFLATPLYALGDEK